MEFITKFNLGDPAFVLHENKIVKSTIYKIFPSHVSGTGGKIGDSERIDCHTWGKDQYCVLKLVDVMFDEDQIFPDRKTLIASL